MHNIKGENGVALVMLLIVLTVLLGVSALAIDLGVLYVAEQQAQDAADAAALAGITELQYGMAVNNNMDQTAAAQEAIKVGSENTILKTPVTILPEDVTVGAWDSTNKKIVAWNPDASEFAVQVTVHRTHARENPIPTFFAKVMGIQDMEVSRSSIAGLSAKLRKPINIMLVQDASTSFQPAWTQATDADAALLNLINQGSVPGDKAGMVAFNSTLPVSYLQDQGLYFSYAVYPHMNEGIKWTTDSLGRPRKTDNQGNTSATGTVQPMELPLTAFDASNHTSLVPAIDNACKLIKNGLAWGDTDTAAGLTYAIDQLVAGSAAGSDKVIVLVSDGQPHDVRDPLVGGPYSTTLKQNALTAARRAQGNGIKIYTVTLSGTNGVDYQFNESLVTNGGIGFRAASADDLYKTLITVGRLVTDQISILQ